MTALIGIIALGLAALSAPPAQQAATYRIVPGLSRASYAADEVFLRENNRLFTAVGVTTAVAGDIVFNATRLADSRVSEIVVDLRELKSDSDRRDNALREKYLDTRRWPFARLANASFQPAAPSARAGAPFRYTLTGDLTVHGVTRRTTWQGDATFAGDTLRGSARTHVKMSDFGIEVPRLLSLRSEDDVLLRIEFVAVR